MSGDRPLFPSLRVLLGLLAGVVPLLLAGPVQGQELRARLFDAALNTPIAGAFLTLHDSTGAAVATRLSDAQGWAQLPARKQGRFTLRVQRLGIRTVDLEVTLGAGVVVREYALEAEAIVLPAITATGARQCGTARAPAAEAARLWDEVRKALEIARWTETEGALHYVVKETRRRLHPRTLEVQEEQVAHTDLERSGSPFVSFGARDLSERGFIRGSERAGYEYYGPDSEVILSEWFQARHCFSAEAHPTDRELVGLRFTPARNAPAYDITGVLWLERRTAALRVLEYNYSRLPVAAPPSSAGGRIEFQRLATGHWIVNSWWIRAPRTISTGAGTTPLVQAVDQVGREVLSVRPREERWRGTSP